MESGSKSLDEYLKEQKFQEKIFLNIHGHTHSGTGLSKIGSTCIVNAGPLKYGRYAILKIQKVQSSSQTDTDEFFDYSWFIKELHFYKL